MTAVSRFLPLPLLVLALVSFPAPTEARSPGPPPGSPAPATGAVLPLLVLPSWVHQNLGKVTLLDVRDPRPYAAGHLPGAVNVKWKAFSDPTARFPGNLNTDLAALTRLLAALGISGARPVIIYSDPPNNWGEEGRMFWTLEMVGHGQIAIMDGGYPRWVKEGLPVQAGAVTPAAGSLSATWHPERIIGWQELQRRLGQASLTIVDTRGENEYRGATPYGEARGGHIPGAVSLPWTVLLATDGTLRPDGDIRALLASRGIQPDREVALYCTGGVRSGFVYFALRKLGYGRPRNYDGSMWEWSSRPELPMER